MVDFRNLFVNLSNLRRSVKSYFNYESNRCLVLILICAGIHPIPVPEPWKRRCLVLYRLLEFYQFMVSLARAVFSIYNQDDILGLCASVALAAVVITCLLKVDTLKHYQEVIRQSKTFLDSNFSDSGDPGYDASVRQYTAKAAGKATLVIFLLLWLDQMSMMTPTTARNIIFKTPKQFQFFGPMTARTLQEMYELFFVISWGCRYFCCSLSVMPLLIKLSCELKILAHGFESIEKQLQVQVSEDHNNAFGSSWNQLSRMSWLKQILGTTLEQHVEVFRNLQLVQNAVSILYSITHYGALLIISINVLLVMKCGTAMISVILIITVTVIILECYLWSYLIESMEDIMESIARSAAELGTKLAHSPEHHSEYAQMRTSLMIIQINTSQRGWFSCGGIFPISVEAVGDLCMTIYQLSTFLLKFD